MIERPIVGLAASSAVHAALVLVVLLVVPRADVLPPLFIDLTEEPRSDDRRAGGAAMPASGIGAGARSTAPAPRAAVPRREIRRPAPRSAERSAPPPSVARAVEPLTVAPPPAAPPPTPMPRPSAEPAPMPSSAPSAAPAPDTAPAAPPALGPMMTAGALPRASGGGTSTGSGGALPGAVASGGGRSGDSAGGIPGGGGRGGADGARATPGGGGEAGAEYGPYLGWLRTRIQEVLRYPAVARRRGLAGTVVLELTIQPSGAVANVAVLESSSHAVLDAAAVEAVRALRPQPLPRELPQRTLRVRLPVIFDLR